MFTPFSEGITGDDGAEAVVAFGHEVNRRQAIVHERGQEAWHDHRRSLVPDDLRKESKYFKELKKRTGGPSGAVARLIPGFDPFPDDDEGKDDEDDDEDDDEGKDEEDEDEGGKKEGEVDGYPNELPPPKEYAPPIPPRNDPEEEGNETDSEQWIDSWDDEDEAQYREESNALIQSLYGDPREMSSDALRHAASINSLKITTLGIGGKLADMLADLPKEAKARIEKRVLRFRVHLIKLEYARRKAGKIYSSFRKGKFEEGFSRTKKTAKGAKKAAAHKAGKYREGIDALRETRSKKRAGTLDKYRDELGLDAAIQGKFDVGNAIPRSFYDGCHAVVKAFGSVPISIGDKPTPTMAYEPQPASKFYGIMYGLEKDGIEDAKASATSFFKVMYGLPFDKGTVDADGNVLLKFKGKKAASMKSYLIHSGMDNVTTESASNLGNVKGGIADEGGWVATIEAPSGMTLKGEYGQQFPGGQKLVPQGTVMVFADIAMFDKETQDDTVEPSLADLTTIHIESNEPSETTSAGKVLMNFQACRIHLTDNGLVNIAVGTAMRTMESKVTKGDAKKKDTVDLAVSTHFSL